MGQLLPRHVVRAIHRGVVSTGVGLLASCAVDDAPIPDFELETEWFEVRGYGRDQDEFCGGTLYWLDNYVGVLAEELDIVPMKVGAYNWYSQEHWDELGICGDVYGCESIHNGTPTVFSRDLPHEHEIVHVLLDKMHGEQCVAMLSEGLAEYLRGPGPAIGGSLENSSIEDLLAVSFDGMVMTGSDYNRARHFVSFLVFEFGLDKVWALCDGVPKGSTRVEFNNASSTTLGLSLDELLVSYASYPVCDESADRAKLWECSREPVVQLGPSDKHTFDLDTSCARPEAVGPRGDNFHISYQIRILADGEYQWNFFAHPPYELTGGQLHLEQCASCGDGALGFSDKWSAGFIPLPRWLAAGDYTLEIILPVEFSGAVSVELEG